ncbi:phage tail sheath C-terminal domain-containing protein [Pedobacter sp. ASV1-7]|uniref:phage tail sheath family protein n=1 Tax=Pedobacter sp. ASV1-7 TaxID=3145237 RepID=UPI0032E88A59
MGKFKTPGVYIEEIPNLPPSIVSVETAIPAFIGYTEKAEWKEKDDLRNVPRRITSMLEYEQYFGFPDPERGSLSVVFEANGEVNARVDETKRSKFLMHYSLQLYFVNGGGACWICSVGNYGGSLEGRLEVQDLNNGLTKVAAIDEVTLLVFPDAVNLETKEEYYDIHIQAILQSTFLKDRFTVMDVYHTASNSWTVDISDLRAGMALSTAELKYAAVYFPKLYTGVDFYLPAEDPSIDEQISIEGIPGASKLSDLIAENKAQYLLARTTLTNLPMLLPVSAAIVGIYAQIDNTRGVWKAPANINIINVIRPEFLLTQDDQDDLNIDKVAGKSINVIRSFSGRGTAVVWGARTLAGNDNEWRYVPIRRFFNMIEESIKKATEQFIFEPNDRNTWVKVQSMIENYLTTQFKAGALMGTTTKDAFFVHIGLGQTMTGLDIQEGRMIVNIGMAPIRPTEFIMLQIILRMQNSV